MSTLHTPKPWKSEHRRGQDGMYRTEVFDKNGETIAEIAWHALPVTAEGVMASDREPNARLISAAPDLLEALEAAHEALSDRPLMDPLIIEIRAAISKAKGQS